MSKKLEKGSLTPLSESLRSFFASLVGLAQLGESRKGAGSREEYSPSAELIMKLAETIKGWDSCTFRLFKKDGYSAEIWTDKNTFRQVIVAFRGDEKSIWPVAFEVLDEDTALTGVFGCISRELLAERRAAALRSLERQTPVAASCAPPFESRKQVA
ncbi:MAG: hypothetical protein M0Z67_02685 [Nitrospiraceae bacterium]|nr:hypothetical protein [Nitrospiraceae bacterium]